VAERRDNARVLGHPRACLNAARQTPCEAPCVSRETLASRRSTVAILGSGPALPSPDAPLKLALRRATGSVTASSSRPGRSATADGVPGPPGANGYEPSAAGRHSSLHLRDRL